ncbi:hypothetical protein LTR84_008026 [Exophiala bonariae]|uniref:ASX DEUBAD domain-containing protein n=1 Tax=Exophiala bonariae TaxID=1690606 RepID=A0AAV9NQL7_9EURO|nr:hypothetical protein LTR84_008026 [Exophiala bonariae]
MFGGGSIWGNLGTPAESLAERERPPPAKPIPLEFPCYVPSNVNASLTRQHMNTVRQTLASIRRPLDVKDSHLEHLNIQVEQDIDVAKLVSDDRFEKRPFLYDADLTAMLAELECDNEEAYREVLRLPPLEGHKKPRLTYARNFFVNLEDMSRYWDSSQDNYYEVEAKDPESQTQTTQSPPNAANSPNSADDQLATKEGENVTGTVSQPQESPAQSQSSSVANTGLSAQQAASDTIEIPTRPKMKQVYKGPRLGNGEQMAPSTRVSAVRNLLKMVVHKFNCRDLETNPRDRLRFATVNVPSVFYSCCVARVPADMQLARARMVEGPIMAVHSRSEVRFKTREGLQSPNSDILGERFDLFREVGCLLLLAKQRSREGTQPVQHPAEHEWWASKARWGCGETRWGQLASEVFEDEDPSWSPEEASLQKKKRDQDEEQERLVEAAAAADLKNLRTDDLIAQTSPSGERPKKKKRSGDGIGSGGKSGSKIEYKDGKRVMFTPPIRRKWYLDWTKIRPNASTWDEKVIYRRIGQKSKEDGGDGWDEVFLLSAANHHVCMLKLQVHEEYLEWLEKGEVVKVENGSVSEEQRKRNVLYVTRSRWYDLFEVEQRKELLTGIWKVMCWVNRYEVPKQEMEKMEELKRKQAEDTGDHRMEI